MKAIPIHSSLGWLLLYDSIAKLCGIPWGALRLSILFFHAAYGKEKDFTSR